MALTWRNSPIDWFDEKKNIFQNWPSYSQNLSWAWLNWLAFCQKLSYFFAPSEDRYSKCTILPHPSATTTKKHVQSLHTCNEVQHSQGRQVERRRGASTVIWSSTESLVSMYLNFNTPVQKRLVGTINEPLRGRPVAWKSNVADILLRVATISRGY